MSTTIARPADLLELVGQDLGTSAWLTVPQSDIDMFAKATHDEQWIHVDADRAKSGPFGGTIAHGYLTLALLIPLWADVLVIEHLRMAVNYGVNKVRFPAPVPAGARVQLHATLAAAEPVKDDGIQVTVDATVQVEGSSKPVCAAQMVLRYYS